MQVRLAGPSTGVEPTSSVTWLDLDALTDVELTSQDPAYPIRAALLPSSGLGWRAGDRGASVSGWSHTPQRLWRIRLRFDAPSTERTQEFVLRWSGDGGRTFHEIVRQQYTFSPLGATLEVEDLRVDLAEVTTLELMILPDQRGEAFASPMEWRLA